MYRLTLLIIAAALLIFANAGCGPGALPNSIEDALQTITPPSSRRSDLITATPKFGDLVIRPGTFEMKAKKIPWSSWWYPLSDNTLFHNDNGLSPLEKYDLYMSKAHHKITRAAQTEANRSRFSRNSPWEGLCDAWASAALLEAEPLHPITAYGITFSIADLKGLLLKTYEQVDGIETYGQRYNGSRGDDFEDIYPDQFHKLLQVQLAEKRRGFILDRDPSLEVWNQPVYAAYVTVEADPQQKNVMHVDAWLRWADDVSAGFDTIGTIPVNHEYTYDLYGYPQADGSLRVVYGLWTGSSLDDHPDYITLLPEDGASHRSSNPEIDPEIVKEILSF